MFFSKSLQDKAQEIINKAKEKGVKITTAESCTGGLVAALFTEISDSSQVFDRGFVTYSNDAKMQNLAVKKSSLEKHGAVSAQVAEQMAIGAIKNSDAQISVAITGIAGPNGASPEKPVGLVYIATANSTNNTTKTRKFNFYGNRTEVRKSSLITALAMISESLG